MLSNKFHDTCEIVYNFSYRPVASSAYCSKTKMVGYKLRHLFSQIRQQSLSQNFSSPSIEVFTDSTPARNNSTSDCSMTLILSRENATWTATHRLIVQTLISHMIQPLSWTDSRHDSTRVTLAVIAFTRMRRLNYELRMR